MKLCLSVPAYLLIAAFVLPGCTPKNLDSARAGFNQSSHVLPQRIVSLTPSNTEILFALGLEDRVVGVTKQCTYPPEARNKAKVGDMNISLEAVVALRPDLVLAHKFLNDSVVRRLKSLGVRVIATDPKTFDGVCSDIRLIGRETGTSTRAEAMVRSMLDAVSSVKKRSAKRNPVNALVIVQVSPLWVAGPSTFVDEMLDYAGGENVAHDTKPGFNLFSMETAIARNPQVIVVTRAEDKFFLERNWLWKRTKAVQTGRVAVIDASLIFRPGPRLAMGLEKLDEALHPEAGK